MSMVHRLHKGLHRVVHTPLIQLVAGLTLFISTFIDNEQTALHHGFRFFILWRSIPDILQALERIAKGLDK